MRGRTLCKLCPRRGNVAIGQCNSCNALYCGKHGSWHNDMWMCDRCIRQSKKVAR